MSRSMPLKQQLQIVFCLQIVRVEGEYFTQSLLRSSWIAVFLQDRMTANHPRPNRLWIALANIVQEMKCLDIIGMRQRTSSLQNL